VHGKAGLEIQARFAAIWLPNMDAYRSFCIAPSPSVRGVLEGVGSFPGNRSTY